MVINKNYLKPSIFLLIAMTLSAPAKEFKHIQPEKKKSSRGSLTISKEGTAPAPQTEESNFEDFSESNRRLARTPRKKGAFGPNAPKEVIQRFDAIEKSIAK